VDGSATYDEMPTSVLRLVNERCNRFEADRRAGRVQTIDDYLSDLEGETRTLVRAELIALGDEYDQTSTEVPTTIGGYDVVRCLGSGGMGSVFLARDPRLGRNVAVKVLRPALAADPAARDRFRREALATGRLDHPNVVPALDAGEENGSPYLVSSYVEGEDLAHLVRRIGPLDTKLAISYATQAAHGLAHAHERGIVHRDVKPANLILGSDGVIRVLDLGLARIRGISQQDQTSTGIFMGTPSYAAPEQIVAPVTVDARSDVYGLGGVLHYLLTGRAPRPWDDFRKLPAQPGRALRRMLASDPDERPASMDEVIELLETSPGPSRRAVLATAGATAVLAASGGALVYFQPWRREKSATPPRPEPSPFSHEQLEAAARNGIPVEWTDEYGISFVLIPPGQAWVGTPPEEIERLIKREPDPEYHPYIRGELRRVINFDNPFYLSRTELTIGQMKAIVRPRGRRITDVEKGEPKGYALRNGRWVTEPGRSWQDAGPECPLTDDHPAINLTWNDATGLARFLNSLGKGGPTYFVPTEDEWEYACLGGILRPAAGENPPSLEDMSVFDVLRPLPVGSRFANPWGLFDMLGNLLEWCRFVSTKGEDHNVAPLRGGKFNDKAYRIRPAARVLESKKSPLGGVRLAMTAVGKPTGGSRVLGK